MTEEQYKSGLRCRGICSICDKNVSACYQFVAEGRKISPIEGYVEDNNPTMKRVNCHKAMQALFEDNKKVLVRCHCNGTDIDEVWKVGLNISIQCEIKVNILLYGEFYILD